MNRRNFLATGTLAAAAITIPSWLSRSPKNRPHVIELHTTKTISQLLPPFALKDFANKVLDLSSGKLQILIEPRTLAHSGRSLHRAGLESPYKLILYTSYLRTGNLQMPSGPWSDDSFGSDTEAKERWLLSSEGLRAWRQAYLKKNAYPFYLGSVYRNAGAQNVSTIFEVLLNKDALIHLSPDHLRALEKASHYVGQKVTRHFLTEKNILTKIA